MPDVPIPLSPASAGVWQYTVPDSGEVLLKAVRGDFDGSGIGSAWFPAVRIIAPGGVVDGEYPLASSVAAGGSATVDFFPDAARGAGGGSTGLGFEHNDALVATETAIDFEDGGGVTWTLTDDAPNSRVKVAAAAGGGGGVPNVATLWRSFNVNGDPSQAVGAHSSVALHFLHTSLPSDGSVSFNALSPAFVTFNVECISLEMLWVHMDGGTYNRSGFANANSRILQAQIPTPSNMLSVTTDPVSGDDAWLVEIKPNAHVVNDTVTWGVYNGDAAAHNITEGFVVIYFWPVTGYTGGIPGWPP